MFNGIDENKNTSADRYSQDGGCRIPIRNKDALGKLRPMLGILAVELEKINVAFDQILKFTTNLPEGKQKLQAYELMINLLNHKETYFNADINDAGAKSEFLNNCKKAIEAKADSFNANLGLLRSFANFFIKLVNLVLPSSMKFGLFEPKQTEAQAIIKNFESALVKINKGEDQLATDEAQAASATA